MSGAYSLRDLRSALIREDLRRDLQGSHDGISRRWSFPSKLARDEARVACEARPTIIRTFPYAREHVQTIREHGGFDVIGQHEAGGIRSPHRTVIFNSVQDRINTEAALFPHLRSSDERCAKVAEAAGQVNPAWFALREHRQALTRLRAGLGWQHDAELIEARIAAASAAAPPTDGARRASLSSVTGAARLRVTDFNPQVIEPTEGVFYGKSLARSDHHVALRDHEGNDVVFLRERLVLPVSARTRRELLPLYGAALHVAFDQNTGRAFQRNEPDPDIGAVLVCAVKGAAQQDVVDILHFEEHDAKDDVDGTFMAESGFVTSLLDAGATAVYGRTQDLQPDAAGRIRRDHPHVVAQSQARYASR
jgi:hypothetical protein